MYESYQKISDFNQEVSKNLKYFEDLSSTSNITPLINEYNNLISKHTLFMQKYRSNKKNNIYANDFLIQSNSFAKGISKTTHELKDILKDFVLVKQVL